MGGHKQAHTDSQDRGVVRDSVEVAVRSQVTLAGCALSTDEGDGPRADAADDERISCCGPDYRRVNPHLQILKMKSQGCISREGEIPILADIT